MESSATPKQNCECWKQDQLEDFAPDCANGMIKKDAAEIEWSRDVSIYMLGMRTSFEFLLPHQRERTTIPCKPSASKRDVPGELRVKQRNNTNQLTVTTNPGFEEK